VRTALRTTSRIGPQGESPAGLRGLQRPQPGVRLPKTTLGAGIGRVKVRGVPFGVPSATPSGLGVKNLGKGASLSSQTAGQSGEAGRPGMAGIAATGEYGPMGHRAGSPLIAAIRCRGSGGSSRRSEGSIRSRVWLVTTFSTRSSFGSAAPIALCAARYGVSVKEPSATTFL
jgi:hypothetical protein